MIVYWLMRRPRRKIYGLLWIPTTLLVSNEVNTNDADWRSIATAGIKIINTNTPVHSIIPTARITEDRYNGELLLHYFPIA